MENNQNPKTKENKHIRLPIQSQVPPSKDELDARIVCSMKNYFTAPTSKQEMRSPNIAFENSFRGETNGKLMRNQNGATEN